MSSSSFLKKVKPHPIPNEYVCQTQNDYRNDTVESLCCLYFINYPNPSKFLYITQLFPYVKLSRSLVVRPKSKTDDFPPINDGLENGLQPISPLVQFRLSRYSFSQAKPIVQSSSYQMTLDPYHIGSSSDIQDCLLIQITQHLVQTHTFTINIKINVKKLENLIQGDEMKKKHLVLKIYLIKLVPTIIILPLSLEKTPKIMS